MRQLLDNAVKYSRADTAIEISARFADETVMITVRDHGQGIAEADIPHIFEKFYRGQHRHVAVPGAGLGLAIVRAVIDAHAGRITVERPQGDGVAFHLSLPMVRETS